MEKFQVTCRELGDRLSLEHVHRSLKKKELIFKEASSTDNMYLIRDGYVKIFSVNPRGKQHIIRILSPNEIIGIENIYEKKYLYSAQSMTPVNLCVFKRESFLKQLEIDKELTFDLLRHLITRLKEATANQTKLAIETAESKILSFLRDPPEHFIKKISSNSFRVLFPYGEVAKIIGINSETFSRVLAGFKEKGWIKTKGRLVQIQKSFPKGPVKKA